MRTDLRHIFVLFLTASLALACGSSAISPQPDAGSPSDAGLPPDASMSLPSSQCTSHMFSGGTVGGEDMDPGLACIACHYQVKGPFATVAGTVYPTEHEPDLCFGASGISVVITDAAGHSTTLVSNDAGNFHAAVQLQFPITATVQTSRGTRSMMTPQMSGDCNSCHTASGANGAPGRIFEP